MNQKIIKTGNSAAVTIPAGFVRDLGIRIGDTVRVEVETDRGRITYLFSGPKQLPLSESFLHRKKGK